MIDVAVLPAFAGLDVHRYLVHAVERGACAVTFTDADLASLAARINELGAIVAQNAMTADDLAYARAMATTEREAANSLDAALRARAHAQQAMHEAQEPKRRLFPSPLDSESE